MGGDIPRCVYFCMDVESGQLELKKKKTCRLLPGWESFWVAAVWKQIL